MPVTVLAAEGLDPAPEDAEPEVLVPPDPEVPVPPDPLVVPLE